MPGEVVALKGLALSGNGLHISTNDIKDPAMLPVDKHPYITASKEVGFGLTAPLRLKVRPLWNTHPVTRVPFGVANTVHVKPAR